MSKEAAMHTYRFDIKHTEIHFSLGEMVYGGVAYIKAPNLDEAIYFFKQYRYKLKEIQRAPWDLSPLGSDCTFTVRVATEEEIRKAAEPAAVG